MTEHALTLRELNRALLARQLLLERERLPVVSAVERVAGLQAQWYASPYIGLWSRLADFERRHLTEALEGARVVKATLMRATLHIVSAGDYLRFAAALKRPALTMLEKRARSQAPELDLGELSERVLSRVRQWPQPRATVVAQAQLDPAVSEWMVWYAIKLHGNLLNTPPSGVWGHNREGPYAPASQWIRAEPGDASEGGEHLVRRYLAAFGPSSRADIASWSGLPGSHVAEAIDALGGTIVRFRDEKRRILLDLTDAPRPPADTPAAVRFLPKWDSSLLAYAPPERERILPERYRKTVIRKNGDVLTTFLVDGFVAGVWRVERKRAKSTLVLEPFEPLARGARHGLADEGEALVRFVEPEARSHDVRVD